MVALADEWNLVAGTGAARGQMTGCSSSGAVMSAESQCPRWNGWARSVWLNYVAHQKSSIALARTTMPPLVAPKNQGYALIVRGNVPVESSGRVLSHRYGAN